MKKQGSFLSSRSSTQSRTGTSIEHVMDISSDEDDEGQVEAAVPAKGRVQAKIAQIEKHVDMSGETAKTLCQHLKSVGGGGRRYSNGWAFGFDGGQSDSEAQQEEKRKIIPLPRPAVTPPRSQQQVPTSPFKTPFGFDIPRGISIPLSQELFVPTQGLSETELNMTVEERNQLARIGRVKFDKPYQNYNSMQRLLQSLLWSTVKHYHPLDVFENPTMYRQRQLHRECPVQQCRTRRHLAVEGWNLNSQAKPYKTFCVRTASQWAAPILMLRRGKDSASADSADATRVTNSTTNSTKGPDPAPAVDQIKHDVFSPQFGRVGYGYGMANTNKLAMGQLSSNNIKLPVSALGSTETPTTSGEDPEQLASTTAAWVKQYGVDGIADGNAEQWITDVTNALRAESPQGQYMLTHARAYVTVNTKVGGSIDRYNTQFYNQGASEYTTCDGLLTESSSNNPKPSVFEIQANGFELNKVVIGKPGSTGTGDASNGQTSTSTRAGYVSQAKGEGKRMDESLLCVDLRTPSTDPPTLAHLVALLLMLRLRPWVHLAASIATGTDDASPTSLGSPGGGVTAATAGASPTSSGSASATDHDSASASTTAPTDAGSDGSFVDNSSPASQTTDTNAAAPSTTAFNNGQRTPGSAARLQHLTTVRGHLVLHPRLLSPHLYHKEGMPRESLTGCFAEEEFLQYYRDIEFNT
ncbi:hypothetical protein DFJ43DRAFT_1207079 [Lentinula guzmanii]|uniref:Uncharacterized protein n=1 Tax=Lentinula guzmanii TaxID=2804957 RepID=A0AA38MW76_9AGAR|nr:hypothetical protein DFJ43DRAFT_1207079 [Lentinula guzmanii]